MITRVTPDLIEKLKDNEIFVFGSNLSGNHGKGAAKTALGFGAKFGQGAGLQGRTYGIPTKSRSVYKVLTIDEIRPFVNDFILFAKN
jgi:proteasome assembly chaperone (PAC2) family protein